MPAFLWGVAFANIVHGVPIDADKEYTGNLFTLLNPFGLLGGLVTLTLFLTHGAMFVALKTDGEIRQRARDLSVRLGLVAAVVAVVFLVWTQIDTGSLGSAVLFVLAAVALVAGTWLAHARPRGLGLRRHLRRRIALAVAGLFVALFPDVMPTTLDRRGVSLTTTNASATAYTLKVMTWVAVIFTPIVLGYQAWTYWVFRKRIADPPHPDRRARRPMRPLDPRLLPHLRPGPRSAGRGAGRGRCRRGLLTVAQAFALGTLVVDVVTAPAGAGVAHAALWLVGVVLAGAVSGVRRRRGHRARLRPGLHRRCGTGCSSATAAADPLALSRRRPASSRCSPPAGSPAIEPYLTRYLPVPGAGVGAAVAALLAIAWLDPLSGLVVALTLPLVPVFAVLVGHRRRATGRRASGVACPRSPDTSSTWSVACPRWSCIRRATAQSATIRRVTERYRRATLDTLRLAFASSAVLELVATLSVALVAVCVGLRLASGDLDFQTALIVLLLAPEAYWPLRRVGAEFHAAAEGVATFESATTLLDTPPVPDRPALPAAGPRPVTVRGPDRVLAGPLRRRPSRGSTPTSPHPG